MRRMNIDTFHPDFNGLPSSQRLIVRADDEGCLPSCALGHISLVVPGASTNLPRSMRASTSLATATTARL